MIYKSYSRRLFVFTLVLMVYMGPLWSQDVNVPIEIETSKQIEPSDAQTDANTSNQKDAKTSAPTDDQATPQDPNAIRTDSNVTKPDSPTLETEYLLPDENAPTSPQTKPKQEKASDAKRDEKVSSSAENTDTPSDIQPKYNKGGHYDFHEVRLAVGPGLSQFSNSPFDDNIFSLYSKVSYFATPRWTFQMPYTFFKNNDEQYHRIGIGPGFQFQAVEWLEIYATFDLAYLRLFGNNELGWGTDISVNFAPNPQRDRHIKIGPYFRFEQVFQGDIDNLNHFQFGLAIHFRKYSDMSL